MKKKPAYSMTAKERKALRREEEEKRNKAAKQATQENADVMPEETVTDAEQAAAPALTKKRLWIPITGIVLALVIILTAVLLLVFVPRSRSRYPRAEIELSDGRKLTLTIWEEDCPIAATNFIFLSKIDFFTYDEGDSQGSLMYDVQQNNQYMRFGAYYDYSANARRDRQTNYVNNISRSIFNVVNLDSSYENNAQSNKFGYRLYRDSGTAKDRYHEKYVLSFNNSSAADFVINMGDNNRNFGSLTTSNLVAFGQFEDEASQKVLDEIFAMEKNENTGISGAVGTQTPVRIRKISFRNLGKKKWKNFEFIRYMLKARDGETAFSGWVG